MNSPLFIGIDIGTQGTKTVVSDVNGKVLNESFVPSKLIRPNAYSVYEDPEDIFNSVIVSVKEVVNKTDNAKNRIKAIGIDAQMAGIMAIGEDFEAVTPLDSWLDTRCCKYTEKIKEVCGDKAIEKSGGQIIHSHASKILWWKNEQKDVYKKIKKFVEPNGYVAGKLCGLKAKDAFMDYTFLHFNCFSDNLNLKFNKEMLKEFGVEEEKMPKIVNPLTVIGKVKKEYAEICGLGEDVQVIAGCGDTAASSLGAGVTEKGIAYDVAGTASVFACCTDKFSPDVKNHTLLYSRSVIEGLYLPLAYISGGGLCLKWFSNLVGKDFGELNEFAKTVPVGSDDCYFIPHFTGRTFPLDDSVKGAFIGLKGSSDIGVMYRAILEGIAYEYKSYLDILLKSGALEKLTFICGTGGGAKSEIFARIKADVLDAEYLTFKSVNSAPVAVGLLAAKGTGYLEKDLKEIFKIKEDNTTVYSPDKKATESYKKKAEKYLSLLNGYGKYVNN